MQSKTPDNRDVVRSTQGRDEGRWYVFADETGKIVYTGPYYVAGRERAGGIWVNGIWYSDDMEIQRLRRLLEENGIYPYGSELGRQLDGRPGE